MQIEPGTFCPLIKDECVQFKCMFWTQLRGKHPQTGEPLDEWDCAIKWLPILMIENTKEAIGVSASIDSFRNEMVRGQQAVLRMAANGDVANGDMKEIADARDDHS